MQRTPRLTTCTAPSPHPMRLVKASEIFLFAMKQSQGSGMMSTILLPSPARSMGTYSLHMFSSMPEEPVVWVCAASTRCHSTDSHEHAPVQGRAEAGSALLGQGPLQGIAHKGEDGHGAHALPLCWQGAYTDPCPSCQHASCQNAARGDSAADIGPAMSSTRPAVLICCWHAHLAGRGQWLAMKPV